MKVPHFKDKTYLLGNRHLRDLAEDDETEFDRNSMHPRHEQTHNSKNHKEFGNVTGCLKEVRTAICRHFAKIGRNTTLWPPYYAKHHPNIIF